MWCWILEEFSSFAAPEIVKMITPDVASDENIVISVSVNVKYCSEYLTNVGELIKLKFKKSNANHTTTTACIFYRIISATNPAKFLHNPFFFTYVNIYGYLFQITIYLTMLIMPTLSRFCESNLITMAADFLGLWRREDCQDHITFPIKRLERQNQSTCLSHLHRFFSENRLIFVDLAGDWQSCPMSACCNKEPCAVITSPRTDRQPTPKAVMPTHKVSCTA